MTARASLATHPLSTTLAAFPLALWSTAVVFDVLGLVTGNPTFRVVAFYNIGMGILGALAAAVPALVDAVAGGRRAARAGAWPTALHLGITVLFTLSWLGRTRWGSGYVGLDAWLPELAALVALAVLLPAGWLGGTLVAVPVPVPVRVRTGRRRAA